ncbi:cation acetate symporter [Streptomyces sp. NPDC048438]|uniref:sodium:solute symporter family transporter n=1 Tax=Streptomyces sp. NPDC048438 TaxID=3365551 RepID=UPI00371DFD3E
MTAATAGHLIAAQAPGAVPTVIFLLVVSFTLLLCFFFSVDSEGIEDLYSAGHSLSSWKNALALTGDSISILTLLSTTGMVALAAYDGTTLALSTAGGLGVLLVLARPLRNIGQFTLGDTLDARFGGRSIRIAAAVATITISMPLAVVQLTAAGKATAGLLGLSGTGAAQVSTVFIGAIMICAAGLTGMRGNTMLAVVKTVMLFVCMGLLSVFVMARMGWNPGRLLADAADSSGSPDNYLAPGGFLGTHLTGRFDLISMQLSIVLGAAVVPHNIMRVKAAEHGASARRSVVYAVAAVGAFCAMAVLLGLGAAALGGQASSRGFDVQSADSLLSLVNSLSSEGRGDLFVTMTVSAIFLTSLTVVAALALSAGAALVHDVYVQGVRRGAVPTAVEVRAMRWVTPVVGASAVLLSVLAQRWSIQFLAQFAVAAAASAILPSLVYALFWRRCTRAGVLCSIYAGLGSCVLLQFFGPAVSGTPGALFPDADFAWFPFATTGLVSVPVGFAAGWVASLLSSHRQDPAAAERYDQLADRAVLEDVSAV